MPKNMTGTVGHLFSRATNLASTLKISRKQFSHIYISLQYVIHITIGFLLIFDEGNLKIHEIREICSPQKMALDICHILNYLKIQTCSHALPSNCFFFLKQVVQP